MPMTPHIEKHFTGSETIRDIVIGMSDGLTVPFALTAGLSGAVDASTIVVTAGLAEIAAGSIAMGLGGFLAGKSDADHYASEQAREQTEVKTMPEAESAEVTQILEGYGLTADEQKSTLDSFRKHPDWWVEFMMRFELGLEKPEANRAFTSGLTIGLAYIAGGLIPLAPYFFIHTTQTALYYSVGLTLLALLVFGAFKGRFTGASPIRSGIQTLIIGGLAAGAAFLIAKLIS
ncbi:MAG: VIT1/CCC1 transporter family protein [Anaerolineae bacterium]